MEMQGPGGVHGRVVWGVRYRMLGSVENMGHRSWGVRKTQGQMENTGSNWKTRVCMESMGSAWKHMVPFFSLPIKFSILKCVVPENIHSLCTEGFHSSKLTPPQRFSVPGYPLEFL